MKSLLAAHWAFKKNVETALKKFGLNPGNPKIIIYVSENEGCQQKDIAKNCCVETSTLSSVLSKMEENGLIERKRLGNNKRSYAICLAERGWQLLDEVKKQTETTANVALTGFTPEEIDAFRDYPNRVVENLDKANSNK